MPESNSIPSIFQDASPVGEGDYQVRPGDCLQSIADEHGHFWKTIWDHADNADLRRVRKDPMVIQPGDRLTIPPLEAGNESGGTEQRHRFRRKGVPAVLKIQLLRDGEPRADEPWTLELDGNHLDGSTDDEGRITLTIPPGARRGLLRVGEGEDETIQAIDLGHLAPHDTVRGVQQRLNNLGFYEGLEDGCWSEAVRHAIDAFLSTTEGRCDDELNESTLTKIRDAHGS